MRLHPEFTVRVHCDCLVRGFVRATEPIAVKLTASVSDDHVYAAAGLGRRYFREPNPCNPLLFDVIHGGR